MNWQAKGIMYIRLKKGLEEKKEYPVPRLQDMASLINSLAQDLDIQTAWISKPLSCHWIANMCCWFY